MLDTIGFDERARNADLVVTGEGAVDATTLEGKAPGAVVRRCELLGVRCELFGGTVRRGCVHMRCPAAGRAPATTCSYWASS